MKIRHQVDVRPRRRAEYMPIGDQLDAMMKGLDALQLKGFELPPETQAWIEHCKAVKIKHPK